MLVPTMFSNGPFLRVIKSRYCVLKSRPIPEQQIVHSSKLREFADSNFELDEGGRKFSKMIENTEGKGEIAHYNNFSFFYSVFKRLVLQTRKKKGLFGKGLNII